jgi:hypothetical protein
MAIDEKISKEASSGLQNICKKVYQKPRLEILGDLRAVTLAGSIGASESGTRGQNSSPTKRLINPNTGQPYQ